MSAISKYLNHDLIAEDFTYSEWYHFKDVSKAANQFESVVYSVVYSVDKPTAPPNKFTDSPFIKIGTSSGKGFGMSDDSMSNKHRTKRRKATTQPQDSSGSISKNRATSFASNKGTHASKSSAVKSLNFSLSVS